jgi:hypothetical protein
MPAATRMNELAARKRLLLAETALHRQLIGLEFLHARRRFEGALAFSSRHYWWVLGGAIVAGGVLGRHWRGLVRWLPTVLATWRELHR